MLALIRNFIIVLAVVLGIAFAFFNHQATSVDLLWNTVEIPLVVLLISAFVLGFLVAFCVGFVRAAKLRISLANTRKQIKQLESKLNKLGEDI